MFHDSDVSNHDSRGESRYSQKFSDPNAMRAITWATMTAADQDLACHRVHDRNHKRRGGTVSRAKDQRSRSQKST